MPADGGRRTSSSSSPGTLTCTRKRCAGKAAASKSTMVTKLSVPERRSGGDVVVVSTFRARRSTHRERTSMQKFGAGDGHRQNAHDHAITHTPEERTPPQFAGTASRVDQKTQDRFATMGSRGTPNHLPAASTIPRRQLRSAVRWGKSGVQMAIRAQHARPPVIPALRCRRQTGAPTLPRSAPTGARFTD